MPNTSHYNTGIVPAMYNFAHRSTATNESIPIILSEVAIESLKNKWRVLSLPLAPYYHLAASHYNQHS